MRPPRRLLTLLALLALTGGLVLFGEQEKSSANRSVVTAVVRSEAPVTRHPGAGAVSPDVSANEPMILALRPRAQPIDAPADAFAPHDWTPPPPPPPPAPLPPPPQAPALPFAYLGKTKEDGRWVVFLSKQDRTYVIKGDEVIEGVYQVKEIAPPTLTLTYLPLEQQQMLPIGAAE